MTAAELKAELELRYQEQMYEDHALDLFNPSVETLLAAFMPPPHGPMPASKARGFSEYFGWGTQAGRRLIAVPATPCGGLPAWPIPQPCVFVDGVRGTFNLRLTQLFAGDLVWLFFHDQMGIHRMLGALLDDFVSRRKFPIRPTGLGGFVLETMVREMKAGLGSTVRERGASYSGVLGWGTEESRKLDLNAPKNTEFSQLFHRTIQLASGYYQEKRLAVAIQNTSSAGKPSVATLTTLRDTISLFRRTLDPFRYGRHHTHTLMGIVWTFAAMDLIGRLRSQLGIPEPYDTDAELIPAAYEMLVGGPRGEANRYRVYTDLATTGRDLVNDIQGLDFDAFPPGTGNDALEVWLGLVESKFETYRTAYRAVTGVDLGAGGPVNIEQQL